jgi:glutathione S-transferase
MLDKASSDFPTDLATRFPGVTVLLQEGNLVPRWHLYHAASSICSQKVRATLAATRQSYISHPLDLLKGDSYDAVYVRVRAETCRRAGIEFVQSHSGTTSVATSGCDACVVPTVVDGSTNEIIVDSRHICVELDRRNTAAPSTLLPSNLRGAIEAELATVDNMPNYQLLASTFGKPSEEAPNNFFAKAKVARCEKLLEVYKNDPLLRTAYESKLKKEQAAVERLFDTASLEDAKSRTVETFHALNRRLEANSGPYLFGSNVTLADLFWGVELIRAEDLGLASIWNKLPCLDSYYRSLCQLPALRHAVLNCEGARFKR